MHLNYYEAEWLIKYRMKEARKLTNRGFGSIRTKRAARGKRIETPAIAPVLRKSSNPC